MKITVKHYLNKSLKPIRLSSRINGVNPFDGSPIDNEFEEGYPLYVRVRLKGKQGQLKSDFGLYNYQDVSQYNCFDEYLEGPYGTDEAFEDNYFGDQSLESVSGQIRQAFNIELEMIEAIASLLERQTESFSIKELVYAHTSRLYAGVLQHVISDRAKDRLKQYLIDNDLINLVKVVNWELNVDEVVNGLNETKSEVIKSFSRPILDHLNLLDALNQHYSNKPLWFAIWRYRNSEVEFFNHLDMVHKESSSLINMKSIITEVGIAMDRKCLEHIQLYRKHYKIIHKK